MCGDLHSLQPRSTPTHYTYSGTLPDLGVGITSSFLMVVRTGLAGEEGRVMHIHNDIHNQPDDEGEEGAEKEDVGPAAAAQRTLPSFTEIRNLIKITILSIAKLELSSELKQLK